MRRRARIAAAALGALLVTAGAALAPVSAPAEQASQPSAAVAGRLDAGRYHTCAIVPVASLRCWGYGSDGALGYGNTAWIGDDETPGSAGPVPVGAGRSVQAVSAGSVHTCALLDDGNVRCWGFGGDGRLGYGNILAIGDDEPAGAAGPVQLGTGRTAKAVSSGRAHSCALLDDDNVRCWGFNFDGRLGYGFNTSVGDNESPASAGPVPLGAGRSARAITAGDSHTCVLLDDGNVRCFGYGATGTLGYASVGHVGDDETPDLIGPVDLGAGRTAVAIAAGDFHNCAVLDNGSVRCWGFGGKGRLGYGNTDTIGDTETPGSVVPVILGAGRTATAITAGGEHSCALLDNGTVVCWGAGDFGQLGYAHTANVGDDEPPAAAGPVDLGAGRTAVSITAGVAHTCARLDDDSVRCWGRAINAELGYCSANNIGDDETPAAAGPVNLGAPAAVCPPPAPPAPPAAPALPAPPGRPAAPPPPPGPDATARAAQREAARAAGFRACRATVARRARTDRARARRERRTMRRTLLLRSAVRRAAQGRRRCLTRFARIPGRVTALTGRSPASHAVVLSFRAPGSDGSRPPAARGYLVKQSRRPIRSARDFDRGDTLCGGTCRFAEIGLNAKLSLTVTDLRPRTTYYYAVAARDNVSGRLGPRSRTVRVRTR